MSPCSGACCAVFTIRYTVEELRARTKAKRGPDGEWITGLRDAEQLADMLVPLGHEEASDRAARFGTGPVSKNDLLYTCRHWDEETRLCGIYEDRPEMCRAYPQRRPCTHGCGYCGGIDYDEEPASPEAVLAALSAKWAVTPLRGSPIADQVRA